MRVTVQPECDEDVVDIRSRAAFAKTLSKGVTDPMYWAVAQACVRWDAEHPDLMHLNPGSVIRVPSGLLYIVLPDSKWLRLANHGDMIDTRVIDPRHAEWSDADVVWSAS